MMGTRQKNSKKSLIEKALTNEKPTLEIRIIGMKCDVDVNPEVYSKDDKKRLKEIVNQMSKDIYIDKTYVSFRGNRFKDAFIKEDSWYDLVRLILKSDFGRKSKKANEEIMSGLMTIAIVYLYDIASKYGFDASDIDISVSSKSKFYAEYYEDNRTSWTF